MRVHVRWAPIIDDAARLQLEERYRLARAEPMGDRTFAYALTDLARDNISNLVLDPAVDDTHEIDRTAFRVWDTAPRLPYVTSIPGMPVVLELLSVLGFLGGLASISLALFKRAAPALARDWILSLATGGSQPLRFWLRIALVAAVLLLGVGLRAWRLGDQPAHNATADEYALTWAGMTLVCEWNAAVLVSVGCLRNKVCHSVEGQSLPDCAAVDGSPSPISLGHGVVDACGWIH